MAVYSCTDCASLLDRDDSRCDHCGSTNRSIHHVIDEAVAVDDWVAVKQKERDAPDRRPHRETTRKAHVWNHDRQQHEDMTLVVERDRDWYEQTWRDEKMGAVTFHKEGRLSDPSVHGESARRRRRT